MSVSKFIEQINARFPEETVESYNARISCFYEEIKRIDERSLLRVHDLFPIILLTAEIVYLEAKKAELVVGAV